MDYFDTNRDGSLDKDEWSFLFQSLSQNLPADVRAGTEEEWLGVFDMVDAGEDGRLRECTHTNTHM